MRFDSFLQAWNPPLYRQYSREKEVAKRLRSTGSLGPEDFLLVHESVSLPSAPSAVACSP